jgi:hypothetical protein
MEFISPELLAQNGLAADDNNDLAFPNPTPDAILHQFLTGASAQDVFTAANNHFTPSDVFMQGTMGLNPVSRELHDAEIPGQRLAPTQFSHPMSPTPGSGYVDQYISVNNQPLTVAPHEALAAAYDDNPVIDRTPLTMYQPLFGDPANRDQFLSNLGGQQDVYHLMPTPTPTTVGRTTNQVAAAGPIHAEAAPIAMLQELGPLQEPGPFTDWNAQVKGRAIDWVIYLTLSQ